MKADLRFDFVVDMQKSSLTVRREFAAKRQLVWDCHTKREHRECPTHEQREAQTKSYDSTQPHKPSPGVVAKWDQDACIHELRP